MADKSSLIKITVDADKGIVTVNKLKVALNDVKAASDAVNQSLKNTTNTVKQETKAVEGSASALRQKIAALKQERDENAKNSQEYLKKTLKIKEVERELKNLTATESDVSGKVQASTAAVKGSAAAIEQQIIALKNQRAATAATNAEYVKQTQVINKLEAELLQLTHVQHNVSAVSLKSGKALGTLNTRLGSTNSAAGLAGASVMETGRLISDLPYGIQGVANNLSQLGSMFGMLVAEAAKMNNGLSTSKNVIGLLRAQFMGPLGVIVVFQAAVAAIEAFSASQRKAKKEAEELNNTIEDQTKSLREQQTIFSELSVVALTDEAIDVLGSQIKEVGTFLEAAKQTNGELTGDIIEFATEQGKRIVQAQVDQAKLRAEILAISEAAEKMREEGRDDTDEYEESLQRQRELSNQFKDAILEEKDALAQLNLEKQDEIELTNETNNSKNTSAKEGTLDWYNEQIEKIETLRDSTATTSEKFFDLTEEIKALKAEMEEKFGMGDEERPNFADDITASANDAGVLYKDQLLEMGLSEEEFTKNSEARARRAIAAKRAEVREELQVHNAKTKIQLERNNHAVQGFKLLGSIAKEGSKLQALALIGENAAGIAKTIISTKAANAAVKLKYSLVPGGELLAKKQIVANNISAAIGIASQVAATQKALAAMKATESAAATPRIGDDDTGGEAQQPDFNIVGASQLNQLATTIAGQEEQPVRAYVVASDVSTAQELDRNILSEASIG